MKLLSKIKDAKQRLSGFWAIEKNSYMDILKIYSNFESNPKAFIKDVNALNGLFDFELEDIVSINGDEATINIKGPLVDVQDCSTAFFGCTSYVEIIEAIKSIESMEHITKVIFDIDSPGGMVAGCDNAAISIGDMKKPTEARVGVMAASAAYWLASQCDSIVATSATASFGSIGVVVEYWDGSRSMIENGFDKVCITSSGAPEKRRDALTEEGSRKIKTDLDAIEQIFFRRVAEGRGLSTSIVAANFGQGGMYLAEKSLSVGMIDRADFKLNNNNVSTNNKKEKVENKMNLKEILSKNPEAQTEVNAMISNAVKAVEEKHTQDKKELSVRVDKASKYLTSSYNETVKTLAVEVIKGEKTPETLEAVVEHIDKLKEEASSSAASEETVESEETAPQNTSVADKNDGAIHDEESYQSTLARIKKQR